MNQQEQITQREILLYEISASWWAGFIGATWGRELGAKYFAWKVRRKYARYAEHRAITAAKLPGNE